MEKPNSPCDEYCDFGGPKGWCLSCGRTRAECDKWWKMKPQDAQRLLDDLPKLKLMIAHLDLTPNRAFEYGSQKN
tara:strand:+ start:488 stop:712 length:225 start_codon:yes stop_codon:yes gene_type:complete